MISKVDMETGHFRAFNHVSSLLNSRLPCYVLTLVHVGSRDDRSLHPSDERVEQSVC